MTDWPSLLSIEAHLFASHTIILIQHVKDNISNLYQFLLKLALVNESSTFLISSFYSICQPWVLKGKKKVCIYLFVVINDFFLNIHSFESLSTASMITSAYTCCKWWRGLSPFSTSSRDHTVNSERGNFVVHHFTAFVNPECVREKNKLLSVYYCGYQ